MESILLVGSIVLASIWTLGWLIFRKHSLGHASQIIPSVCMWGAIYSVYDESLSSSYHLLWLMPVCIVFGSIIGIALLKFFISWDELMKKVSGE